MILRPAHYISRDVLGANVSAPQELPSHGVTTVFVELENTKLELLLPLGANSPIAVSATSVFRRRPTLGAMAML